MRFLVVGAGATGGFLGAHMASAGLDVTFLVREGRAAQLRRNGLQLRGPVGDFDLAPAVITSSDLCDPFDVVVLAVKAYQLGPVLDDIAPAVSAQTIILPVLNGMRHLGDIAARFGPGNLVGCTLKVSATLGDDGVIIQHAPIQELAFGEMDGSASNRLVRLHDALRATAIDVRLSTSIVRELWEKWVFLASAGAVNCLMRGTIGEVVACPGGADLVLKVIDEAQAIAAAVGEKPSDYFIAWAQTMLTARSSKFASSMYHDLERNRPVEAEHIICDLVDRGAAAGLDLPLLSAARVHLQVYEAGLRSKASLS